MSISDQALERALKLGDEMTDRLAMESWRARRLNWAVMRAIHLLRQGRTKPALDVLEEARRKAQ
jgi:hypothetical protein